jgi:CBS domain-containing protein
MSAADRAVADYMTAHVATVSPTTTRGRIQDILAERDVSSVPVVDGGTLVGIVSASDLLRVAGLDAQPASEIMRTDLVTVRPDDSLALAARRMLDARVHRVLVVDGGRLVGVLSTRDAMRIVVEEKRMEPLSAIMSSPVVTVDARDPLSVALDLLTTTHMRGVLVMDDGEPVGVFTQVEALRAKRLSALMPVEDAMGYEMLCLPTNAPVHRVARYALAMRLRRVCAVEHRRVKGIATGYDVLKIMASG